MGDASFVQPSFLGGEWSPIIQGRMDRPDYRTGLNLCRNGIPVEEGSWTRRPGTRTLAHTRSGAAGFLRTFHFSETAPYAMEFTTGHLRLYAGPDLVLQDNTFTVTDVSAASPAEITTSGDHGWTTADQVKFLIPTAGTTSFAGVSQLLGRQFAIVVTDTDKFTIRDALTNNPVDGATVDIALVAPFTVAKIVDIATQYSGTDQDAIRVVQAEKDALILNGSYAPTALTKTADASGDFFAAFSYATPDLLDGPYLDPPTDGSTLTPDGTTGTVTLVASAITSINDGDGFQSTDVGRMVRLLSVPPLWDVGTAYATGAHVTYNNSYYTAIAASTGHKPDVELDTWSIDTTAAKWTWGVISAVSDTDTIDLDLADADPLGEFAGGDLLNTNAITTWRLGVFSDTTGWPTVGTYHQGRLMLSGVVPNRFDTSMSNKIYRFSPTLIDGTVADDCGMSEVLQATDVNAIFWMAPSHQGVLMGTAGGEWLIQASSLNDPLTPTSIQADRITKFRCQRADPCQTPMALVFLQKFGKKVVEYVPDSYSGKYSGTNIAVSGKHLIEDGVVEMAFQHETTPIIWVRTTTGDLVGCTYRRDSPFGSQPASFSGWHKHTLGHGRTLVSIQSGPSVLGTSDALMMVTKDTVTGRHYVETLTDFPLEKDGLLEAWYLDGGVLPLGGDLIDDTTLRLYGLWLLEGQSVTRWVAGLDLGEATVEGGMIDVPLGAELSLEFIEGITTGVAITENAATFTMSARENYDPAGAVLVDAATQPATFRTEKDYIGLSYDHVRRKIIYDIVAATNTVPPNFGNPGNVPNDTGFNLWDGQDTINAGDDYDDLTARNFFLAEKDIDTGAVVFYPSYNPASTVPAGIGGSDGTYRRFMATRADGFDDNQVVKIVDPRTGDVWTHIVDEFNFYYGDAEGSPCLVEHLRLSDDFSKTISPLAGGGPHMVPLGTSESWTYIVARSTTPNLILTPRVRTDYEVAQDYLLPYASYAFPLTYSGHYFRTAMTPDEKLYVMFVERTGTRHYKLYRFDEPTATDPTDPTSPTGGGFTEVTPWAGAGPDTSATGYTSPYAGDNAIGGTEWGTNGHVIFSLPATKDLACLTKLMPSTKTSPSTDPADLKLNCTYFNTESGLYDHHAAFVTGFMTAAWVSTPSAAAATYAIQDMREINPYLDQSSFLYSADYTKRWLAFTVQPVVGGVYTPDEDADRVVFVQYKFAYGQAPELLQVVDETHWDEIYTDYAAAISNDNVVFASQAPDQTPVEPMYDCGIYDETLNHFWFGAQHERHLFSLDADFSGREAGYPDSVSPPFLRLSFQPPNFFLGGQLKAPAAVGYTYTSDSQLLRPIEAQDSGARNGPAFGKSRRIHQFGALLHQTKGISFSTTFDTLRPAEFKSPGGVLYTATQAYSGNYQGTITDDSSLDGMICWRITRPYPATIVAIGGFIHTQDR